MKIQISSLAFAVAFIATCANPMHASMVKLTAVIDSSQTTNESTSEALGVAMMMYDTETNSFDLSVDIDGLSNPLTASHAHAAPPGVPGSVVADLGSESVYSRDGEVISGTFFDVAYTGDPATLLSGGTYLNFHTEAWPDGEVRGQLFPEPISLTAIITTEQVPGAVESDAYGATMATYDPLTNEISLAIYLYRFGNSLIASHIHEAPVGTIGPPVATLGDASAYSQFESTYTQVFEGLDYEGDPVALLSGDAYLNFHSDSWPNGEIRGQLLIADGGNQASRLVNVSTRGYVGTGEQVLIGGFVINGNQPLPVLATGRGEFLSQFGVNGVLADPLITVFDGRGETSGKLIENDNFGDGPYAGKIIELGLGFDLSFTADAAGLLILPPGAYTVVVAGVSESTGVAIIEAYDAKNAFFGD